MLQIVNGETSGLNLPPKIVANQNTTISRYKLATPTHLKYRLTSTLKISRYLDNILHNYMNNTDEKNSTYAYN